MKEKIIETAGKTWRTLGERGEATISEIAKVLNEREDLVNQAIGWLAREDKLKIANKQNKTLFSLAESEMQSFRNLYRNMAKEAKDSPRQKR